MANHQGQPGVRLTMIYERAAYEWPLHATGPFGNRKEGVGCHVNGEKLFAPPFSKSTLAFGRIDYRMFLTTLTRGPKVTIRKKRMLVSDCDELEKFYFFFFLRGIHRWLKICCLFDSIMYLWNYFFFEGKS